MWSPCWCIYLVYNNNRVCLMNKNFKNVKSTTFLKLKSIDKKTGGFFFTWDIILLRSRGINSKYNVRFHYTLQSFDIFLPSHQISDNHFLASFNLPLLYDYWDFQTWESNQFSWQTSNQRCCFWVMTQLPLLLPMCKKSDSNKNTSETRLSECSCQNLFVH